jgi:CubicO group peptidase (beta-lactamase class C family)
MQRRTFLQTGLAMTMTTPLIAALRRERVDEAIASLQRAVDEKQVAAATLYVEQRGESLTRAFGAAKDEHAMFLLGSISKPIAITSLITLLDDEKLNLEDPLQKYIPAFSGAGRERVTLQHLLTHVSGLPDQLPNNGDLRKSHAPLSEFVLGAIKTPLHFAPGTRYMYSSMAILLACRVAEIVGGADILTLVEQRVLRPLKMEHSSQGLGRFSLDQLVAMQTERAAPEAGGGDPTAKSWDWNSPYWRKLGAPWGGTHASAPDVGRFLAEFLDERGAAVKPATARRMVANHNPAGFVSRGLGFAVGSSIASPGCSQATFGHTGSTGTIAWADPSTRTICVVLTSLPAQAVKPHPRDLAAARIAAAT